MKIIKINESYLNSENLKILNTLGFSTNDSREILKNLSLISNKSYKLVFLSVSILFIISAIIIPLFIFEYTITLHSTGLLYLNTKLLAFQVFLYYLLYV